MGRASLEAVTASIDALYAAVCDGDLMQDALKRIRDLFGGSKACFVPLGPGISPTDTIATDFDLELNKRYVEEFAFEVNDYIDAVMAMPIGRIYKDHALLGREALRKSRFWNEWMAPQNMYGGLGCRLLHSGRTSWFFDVQRGRRQQAFDMEDADLFRALSPTLAKVIELRHRLGRMSLKRDVERRALDALAIGIVAVDAHARVLYANAGAHLLFEQRDGSLRCSAGRLVAGDPACQANLKHKIAEACSGMQLDSASGYLLARALDPESADVALCVIPLSEPGSYGLPDGQPVAMIFARTLELDANLEEEAVRLLGLTPAEAKLASALASGQSLADAADAQSVRITTARTHLARIFQKTGTRQQSQIAALLRAAHLPVQGRH